MTFDHLGFAVNKDILSMCVHGMSNKHIASKFGLDEKDIASTIEYYLDFAGFISDIYPSPLKVYKSLAEKSSLFFELEYYSFAINTEINYEDVFNMITTYIELEEYLYGNS